MSSGENTTDMFDKSRFLVLYRCATIGGKKNVSFENTIENSG